MVMENENEKVEVCEEVIENEINEEMEEMVLEEEITVTVHILTNS
jgi:hypothetical protein